MTDDRLQRVVWRARQRHQLIAGAQHSEQCRCKRVRSADKLRSDECRLCAEDVRKNFVELVAPDVAVCITRRRFEVRVRNFEPPHCRQNFARVEFADVLHVTKTFRRRRKHFAFQIR